MLTDGLQVRRSRAYLDSLSMDGAEVASVGRRLVRVAKAIVPDWNEVCVWSV